jgi:pimeloyl-ACP methyl ester carboxylesterase
MGNVMSVHRLSACCLILWLCLLGHGPAAAASSTHVYLVRGVFNVSVGLDELAGKLKARGVAATVYGPMSAGSVASDAIADYKSGKVRNIVLIGHSLGGGTIFSAAETLKDANIPVALMIVLDASGGPAPANVRRVVNYYVGGGTVTAGPGFHGSLQNVDVSRIPGMGHMQVQSMGSMHQKMISNISAAGGG